MIAAKQQAKMVARQAVLNRDPILILPLRGRMK
jgi:hypothetical protein